MSEKAKRNYPFRGKIYTAEQIDNIISGITFDGYTKDETDELLDLKQNILTAGSGISIENDTISVLGETYTLFDKTDWSELFDVSTEHGYSTDKFIALKNIIIIVFDNSAGSVVHYIPKNIIGKYTIHRGNSALGSTLHAVNCEDVNIGYNLTRASIGLKLQYLTVTQTGNTNDGTFNIYYNDNMSDSYSKKTRENDGMGIYLYVGE